VLPKSRRQNFRRPKRIIVKDLHLRAPCDLTKADTLAPRLTMTTEIKLIAPGGSAVGASRQNNPMVDESWLQNCGSPRRSRPVPKARQKNADHGGGGTHRQQTGDDCSPVLMRPRIRLGHDPIDDAEEKTPEGPAFEPCGAHLSGKPPWISCPRPWIRNPRIFR
jgi:hypothetical protein